MQCPYIHTHIHLNEFFLLYKRNKHGPDTKNIFLNTRYQELKLIQSESHRNYGIPEPLENKTFNSLKFRLLFLINDYVSLCYLI